MSGNGKSKDIYEEMTLDRETSLIIDKAQKLLYTVVQILTIPRGWTDRREALLIDFQDLIKWFYDNTDFDKRILQSLEVNVSFLIDEDVDFQTYEVIETKYETLQKVFQFYNSIVFNTLLEYYLEKISEIQFKRELEKRVKKDETT